MKTKFNPKLPVEDIYFDRDFNCRKEVTPISVKELSESIAEVGAIISPLTVQVWDQNGFKYRLLVGHRRYLAATRFLKWKTVPANIVLSHLTAYQCQKLNFLENLERKDLNIMEEAWALQAMYPEGSTFSLRQIGAALGKPTAWVRIRQKLLTMPEAIQKQSQAGLLSQINSLELGRMDSEEQLFAADAIATARAMNTGGKHLRGLDSKYRSRRTAHKRPEINTMIEDLYGLGVLGFPLRCLAWAAAQITDAELAEDAKIYVQKMKEQP